MSHEQTALDPAGPDEADGADTVSDRARRVVQASPLSQREFAQRIEMDPTALSKALRGTRRLRDQELSRIAEVGEVPLRFLTHGGRRVPAALKRAEARARRKRAEPTDPAVRRVQILQATAQLIARQGFHNVRVADIARACGTSTGTVHYHFDSLDDALRDALFFYADRLHAELEERFATTDDPVERLRQLIEVQLPSDDEDVDEWSVWVQSWNEAMFQPALRTEQAGVYARWRASVVDVLTQCADARLLPRDRIEPLTSRFTGLVDGLAIQYLTQAVPIDVDAMRDLLLDAFEPHLRLR